MFNLKSFIQKSCTALLNFNNGLLNNTINNSINIQQTVRNFKKFNEKGIWKFGYKYTNYYQGGLLPRVSEDKFDEKLPLPLPKRAFNDKWSEKHATFGQNDYIDIFGDGSVKPVDLIKGPSWLVGFNGNEMQRLIRRLKFDGARLQMERPDMYRMIRRRIRYLWRRYNIKFGGKRNNLIAGYFFV